MKLFAKLFGKKKVDLPKGEFNKEHYERYVSHYLRAQNFREQGPMLTIAIKGLIKIPYKGETNDEAILVAKAKEHAEVMHTKLGEIIELGMAGKEASAEMEQLFIELESLREDHSKIVEPLTKMWGKDAE